MTDPDPPAAADDVSPPPIRRADLFGYPIDRVSLDQAVAACRGYLEGDRRPRLVLTLNAATLVMAEDDPAFGEVLRSGDLVLADGVPVVWASRLLGDGLKQRVAGIDLMDRLIDLADRDGLRLYFLGARPEVVGRVVGRVWSEYAGAVVAGYRDGYFGPGEWDRVVERIRRSRADILLVALPSPFKEVWCRDHLDALGVPVVLPVGGAFDVFAGLIPRAPLWMQRTGLEWLWRLMMEPRGKWRRYLWGNTAFLRLCLVACLRGRSTRRPDAPGPIRGPEQPRASSRAEGGGPTSKA